MSQADGAAESLFFFGSEAGFNDILEEQCRAKCSLAFSWCQHK